jgi:hypothetical protein
MSLPSSGSAPSRQILHVFSSTGVGGGESGIEVNHSFVMKAERRVESSGPAKSEVV